MFAINTHHAAEYLGLSKSYLNKLRLTGGGPRYVKAGRRVVYDLTDLELWMTENKVSNTSQRPHLTAQ